MIFNYESFDKEVPKLETEIFEAWVKEIAIKHNKHIKELTYVFCSDEKLLEINQQFLSHDTYTDIITFDNTSNPQEGIESDIYISVERVVANAHEYENGKVDRELSRVMAHGILHLIGFGDKTENEKRKMRAAENEALQFLEKHVSRETKDQKHK